MSRRTPTPPPVEPGSDWVCEDCLGPHDWRTVAADGRVCGCGGRVMQIDADGFEVTVR